MNNIIKRAWNQNRMTSIEDLQGMAFQAESGGHTFEISGIDDQNNAVELSGTVAGVFIRPDQADVALTGTAEDGIVSVTLTDDCYAVAGRFGLTIFVTDENDQKVAVYACVGTVTRTTTGAVAGSTPQDVVDLVNAIAAAIASIPADYTDLMSAIAPTYSNTALYAVGSYAWYDGNLYRCVSAITTAEAWTAAHWEAASVSDDISELRRAISEDEEIKTAWNTITAKSDSPDSSLSVINAYIRKSTASYPGKLYASDSYRCYYFRAETDLYVYAYTTAATHEMRVSNEQPVTGYGAGTDWTGTLYDEFPNAGNPAVVLAGQYVAVSCQTAGVITITMREKASKTVLNNSLDLTNAMTEHVQRMIAIEADTAVSADAYLYVDKVPSYWVQPEQEPTSYSEAIPYLERKIAQIPNGNSLMFVTDAHWFGNQKHSPQLMQYVRRRTGIKPVLFGGDVYGYADTTYAAVKVLGEYLFENRREFRENFIPCVGDHDSNTQVVSGQYVPYEQLTPLFVGDIKRRATFYEPSELVATMATGTDYDEVIAFFRTVYYIDDVSTRTRIIVLNCGQGGTAANQGAVYNTFGTNGSTLIRTQIPFLVSALYGVPDGYNVCVLSHKLSYSSSATNAALQILSDFKIKKPNSKPAPANSGNANIEAFWAYNTQYDFSDAPDIGLLYVIDGHQHIDLTTWAGYTDGTWTHGNTYTSGELDQSTRGQIPCITTQTDAAASTIEGSSPMTVGTTTEQVFDVVTLVSDGIVVTRFGSGNDRRIYVEVDNA